MASFLSPQTTDLNGCYSRIIHREIYHPSMETLNPAQLSIVQPMDSAISPPLSAIELADIEASEIEFSTEDIRIYDNADDLINELHVERLHFQRRSRE